jgi:uncharacterized membrane protein HdeD (DUF308 family)
MEKPTNKSESSQKGFMAFLARPQVRIGLGLAELVLAVTFVSWAIDSGSLLDYAIGGLLTVVGIHDLMAGIKTWRRQK